MTDDPSHSWRQWWAARPRRQGVMMPGGMNEDEKLEWRKKKQREYYKTHKSARIARWAEIIALVTVFLGLRLTFSFSQTTVDIGYTIMVAGIVVAFIVFYFFSAIGNV